MNTISELVALSQYIVDLQKFLIYTCPFIFFFLKYVKHFVCSNFYLFMLNNITFLKLLVILPGRLTLYKKQSSFV